MTADAISIGLFFRGPRVQSQLGKLVWQPTRWMPARTNQIIDVRHGTTVECLDSGAAWVLRSESPGDLDREVDQFARRILNEEATFASIAATATMRKLHVCVELSSQQDSAISVILAESFIIAVQKLAIEPEIVFQLM